MQCLWRVKHSLCKSTFYLRRSFTESTIEESGSESPPPNEPPSAERWPWKMERNARDVLFCSGEKKTEMVGYITALRRRESGWFFSFKPETFRVRYIVILDAVPGRHVNVLARRVAWAALCAGDYGSGGLTMQKYFTASDELYSKCAKERLSWMPAHFGSWTTTKMAK